MPDKTLEQLQAEVDIANATIKNQQEELEVVNQVNADLQEKLEEMELKAVKSSDKPLAEVAKKKLVIPEKTFTVGGEDYRFIIPQFTNPMNKHGQITAEEAMTDQDLLNHLVEINFGGIVRAGE